MMEDDKLIKSLNEKQKDFVLTECGTCVVLAGAGSGKTKALTTKIYYLIKYKQIKPYEILAITFTNKAAKEMKERVESYFNGEIHGIQISTFHSFCSRFLRTELNSNFVIFDDKDVKSVIKSILKKMELDEKEFPVNGISSYIDNLKNLGYYIGKENLSNKEKELLKNGYYDIYEEYQSELEKSNALDFGDLIVRTIQILDKNENLTEKYQNKFKYIMVDEYQDTNDAQYILIKKLYNKNNSLFVIGDEDQSIYSFRGSNVYNILNFEKDFENTKVIKLEENYRSFNNILNVANSVIGNNEHRLGKKLFSSKSSGSKIILNKFYDDKLEAIHTINLIKEKINKGTSPKEISIIYRNNSQSRLFEEQLRKENIPYKIFGGMKFYDRREIKDIISYLRFLINKNDNFSLLRIINLPTRGIGKKTVDEMINISDNENISIYQVLRENKIKLAKKAKNNIEEFLSIFEKDYSKNRLMDIVNEILIKTGYFEMLENSGTYEDASRIDNLKEFISSLYEYDKKNKNINDLLEDIALVNNEEQVNEEMCVNLMTIHSSKGLEFDVVFLVGLEDNIFPSPRSLEEIDPARGLEEERRLFYVAITRAKNDLIISYCEQRFLYGNLNYNSPSVFVNEIPEEYFIFNYLKSSYNQ